LRKPQAATLVILILILLVLPVPRIALADRVVTTIPIEGGSIGTPAFDPANGYIYVPAVVGAEWESVGGQVIYVISGATNTVVATVPAGSPIPSLYTYAAQNSVAVVDSANGDVYVPGYNLTSKLGGSESRETDWVYVISGRTNKVIYAVPINGPPGVPLFDSKNGNIYVPIFDSKRISDIWNDEYGHCYVDCWIRQFSTVGLRFV
jgi:hypothetical protein